MMDINKSKIILFSMVVLTCALMVSHGVLASESAWEKTSSGIKEAGGEAGFGESGPQVDFMAALMGVVNILLTLVGVFFIILLIYGGYLWMDARGGEEKIEKARKVIIPAVIGIVIIIAARIMTEFILSAVLGSSITQ